MNLNEFFSAVYADNVTHDFYVDGSYNTNTYVYGSGIVHVVNGEVQYKKSLKGNNIELAKQRNVAGEMRASMVVIVYAVKMGLKNIRIHYDYSGVEYWATGKWKRNNEFTKGYHEFVQKMLNENPWLHIQFIKVKAHSGDPFNDLADELAKQACGVV